MSYDESVVDETSGFRERLVRQLQGAFSGELAAGLAYRGHARSVSRGDERRRIQEIADEERVHREDVGTMLASLGAGPDPRRERRLRLIGGTIALLCRVGGWYVPMYGAGRLESGNVKEYEEAAEYALRCGHPEFVECLLSMAEVEWEHERYFRSKVVGHPLSRLLRVWPALPPKETIRQRYAALEARVSEPASAVGC